MSSLIAIIIEFVIKVIEILGYPGVFLLMLFESTGVPVPSEAIMPFAGFSVSAGKMSFVAIVILGSLGNVVGSMLAYWIGLKGGRLLVEKYGKYILLSHRDLDRADTWFQKRGELTVFIGRLLPIVRTYISFPAGIAKMNFKKFVFFTTLGVIPWTILFAWLGVKLGDNWVVIREKLHGLDLGILIIIIVVIVLFFVKKYWQRRVK